MKSISLILAAALATSALPGCMTDMDLDVSETAEELSVDQWQPNVRIAGQSSNKQPGVAWFNNRIYMVHTGAESADLWLTKRNEQNKTWVTNTRIAGQRADGGPSLVVWRNRLTMIYRPYGQNRLVMSQMNANETWTPPTQVGAGLNVEALSAPSAVVAQGKLFVGYCTRDGGARMPQVDILEDNGQWQAPWNSPGGDNCETVAVGASTNGAISTLHVVWTTYWDRWWTWAVRRMGTTTAKVSSRAVEWAGLIDVPPMTSINPPSLVSCGGTMHMIHGGGDDAKNIWWTVFQGDAWQPDAQVSGQSSFAGAQLGCAGTVPFMIHNGGESTNLWYSEFR